MKKRIISMALVAIMVVAMIPATLLVASARWLDILAVDVLYTDKSVTVDAQLDDIYKKSELIVSQNESHNSYGNASAFKSYTVATANGLYVWAEIKDYTIGSEYMEFNPNRGAINDVGNHDKFQYYFKTTYKDAVKDNPDTTDVNEAKDATSWWGYFELDYYANNVDGEQFANVNSTSEAVMHHTRYQKRIDGNPTETNDVSSVGITYATKILRDDKGDEYAWVAEFFIPWNTAGIMPQEPGDAPYDISVGLQANNDDWNSDGTSARKGYCYSTHSNASYYNGPDNSSYISFNYLTEDRYHTFYATNKTIELDGIRDDIYANTTKITNTYNWKADNPVDFELYPVATPDGYYLWVHVDDTTMNNAGDGNSHTGEKISINFDMTPFGVSHGKHLKNDSGYGYNGQATSIAGWYEFDYEGNTHNYLQQGNNAHYLKDIDFSVVKIENPDWDGSDTKTQYIGYDMEIFMPFTPELKSAIATQQTEGYNFRFGIEVHDDQTYDSKEERTAISCDHSSTMSGYNYSQNLNRVEFDYDDSMIGCKPYMYVAFSNKTPVMDGKNTDDEYKDGQVMTVNLHGSGTGDDADIFRVITDGKAIFVLMENYDTTVNTNDYIDFMFTIGNRLGGYVTFMRDGTSKGGYTQGNQDMATLVGSNAPANNKLIDNGAKGYTVEFKIELTDDEQALLKAGKLTVGYYAQYHDQYDGGRNYKYSWDDARVATWYKQNDWIGMYSNSSIVYNYENIEHAFTAANVDLGESLAMNFYAKFGYGIVDAQVKVTMNDKVTYLAPQKTMVNNEYKFVFDNIAPQNMADAMDVELIVNGKVVDTIDDYSVLKNLDNLLNADMIDTEKYTAEQEAAMDKLIYNLINYGARAQEYLGLEATIEEAYLANYDFWNALESGNNTNDRTIEGEAGDTAIVGWGVHFNNVNKIFVSYTEGASKKKVYSDAILATEFDKQIEITVGGQTLTASVLDYCAAIKSADVSTAMKNLAQATAGYGITADAFVASFNG